MRYTEIIRNKSKSSSSNLSDEKPAVSQIDTVKNDLSFVSNNQRSGEKVHLHGSDIETIYSHLDEQMSNKPESSYVNSSVNPPLEKIPMARLAFSMSKISNTDHSKNDLQEISKAPKGETDNKVTPLSDVPASTSFGHNFFSYEESKDFEIADGIHIEILSILDEIYKQGKDGKIIQIEHLIEPILSLIDICKTSKAILRKAIKLKSGITSFTAHSLNVAILAVKIGLARGYTDERLFSLALCSLLSDIGMTKVDQSIINKKEKLTSQEYSDIKGHVEHTGNILSKVAEKFPFLIPIVNQMHERENGNGYPDGIKGESIHEFAKIMSLCDVYIALTEPKVNRDNYSGYMALQQIISRRGIDFNPKIIKSLIDVISVFPLESLVRLNNGEIGRVINISSVHPTRPQLSILIDSEGNKISKPKFLDLEKEPLLYIEDPDIEEGVVL